jgi:hypothetical protein
LFGLVWPSQRVEWAWWETAVLRGDAKKKGEGPVCGGE